jgi:predicted N-acetyltransferase YhbS
MHDLYTIRRSENSDDAQKLKELFTAVFHPEKVGNLAETMFLHLPGLIDKYWFIVEEKKTAQIVSAFTLIPWVWELEGVKLKVAEMGIVGTLKEHRRRGLISLLNKEFEKTLEEGRFDLSVIQGIPGFYQQYGYSYAVALENHINLSFHSIPGERTDEPFNYRRAVLDDIPFLMREDRKYRSLYSLSSYRDREHWKYILTDSLATEYGSELWILENSKSESVFYFRIPFDGFGDGLIISEVSEDITPDALGSLFRFCRNKAIEQKKPYLRLNLHNKSAAGKKAIAMGAKRGEPYAWQVKIPDFIQFLTSITPLLEKRLEHSVYKGFSSVFRLDFYRFSLDLSFLEGKLIRIKPGEGEVYHIFSLSSDSFPAICLGHRSWKEIHYIRPDISPATDESRHLMEILFPVMKGWIHEQY